MKFNWQKKRLKYSKNDIIHPPPPKTEDKGQEVATWMSNCTNGVVRSRCMGYEKCWEKESECSWDEMFEKFGWSVANG